MQCRPSQAVMVESSAVFDATKLVPSAELASKLGIVYLSNGVVVDPKSFSSSPVNHSRHTGTCPGVRINYVS